MKKIAAICMIVCMLSALFVPVTAEETAPAATLDDHLIVYYDFEGDTLEEQLSDKASAGKSKENLTVTSSLLQQNNENCTNTTLSPNTGVKDGKLYIDHDQNDRAECVFDLTSGAEDAQGADIFANTSGELTIFIQTQLNTVSSDWIDFLTIKKIGRYYFNTYSQQYYSSFAVRHKENRNIVTSLTDNVYVYGTTLTFAVSYEYDQDAQTLKANVMYSPDEGDYWTSCESEHSNVTAFFTDATGIFLGKSSASWSDRNGDVVVDNVRVYDKALTLDEVKSLLPSDDEVAGDDSTGDTSDSVQDSASNTTAPDTQGTQAPVTTDNVTTSSDSEKKKSGCSSVVFSGVIGLLPLVAGACLILKKKD